jgi:AcrR family transcriptional regulator
MARPATNHEVKKAQIANVAFKAFAKYGFAGTTTKLIAQEAKAQGESISAPLIYHYFPGGKEELFLECLKQLPPLQEFSKILKEQHTEPPEVFLPIIVKTYTEFLMTTETLSLLRIAFTEGNTQPQLLRTVLQDFIPNLLMPLLQYFEGQVKVGKIRPMKFDQIMMPLIGSMIIRRIVLSVLPLDLVPFELSTEEEYKQNLVQTILKGILAE